MNHVSWTFIVWMVLMVALVAFYLLAARRGRYLESKTEDIASQALPAIGAIAEHQHTLRFGRPPTNTPGPPGESVWYPPTKKKRHRHA